MYIFVTYGVEGWRGVQQRGLEIAKQFKKKEVLFWNGYDSDFIKKGGFRCQTVDLSLTDPAQIKFPKKTQAVVFADLPTNELFNLSLFLAAKEKNIPIIVLDQIYRKGQLEEGVYKNIGEDADLLILNGLNFLKEKETKKIKFIPPLANYIRKKNVKETAAKRYGLDPKKVWIFVSGYYKPVYEMAEKAYSGFSKAENLNFIIAGLDIKIPKKEGDKLFLPFLSGDDYLDLLDASDIFVSKFGYLQILEALALGTITVVAGEAGYVLQMKILDEELREIVKYANDSEELAKIISFLLENEKNRNEVCEKISKLHDGSFYGAKTAANYIKKIIKSGKKKKATKRLLILVNDEIKKAEELIKKEPHIYVVEIIASVSRPGPELYPVKRPDEELLDSKIRELIIKQDEVLPHSFLEVYLLSTRKYDGLVNIIPWYELWIKNLNSLFGSADRILVSPKAKYLVANLIKPFSRKIKLVKFKN